MVLKLQKGAEEDNNLICDLAQMLSVDESDVVMNAAGAIASLVRPYKYIMPAAAYSILNVYLLPL